ncbi:hypothetical protein [Streptococcus pyogenes SSI-1]|nr:hypothetical protein [Streptococcus pyogenes SSI-1]
MPHALLAKIERGAFFIIYKIIKAITRNSYRLGVAACANNHLH